MQNQVSIYHNDTGIKRKNMISPLKSLTLNEIIPTKSYYFWRRCLYTKNTLL